MREIKFRGRRLDNEEWIYGSYTIAEMRDRSICHEIVPFPAGEVIREVDPATVGQYTGMKDKSGREIYEGDILTDKYESIGVVEWQNGGFVVNLGDVDIFQIADCFDDSYQMWTIGNIHDNPELLKTE